MALLLGADVVIALQPTTGGAWSDITCDTTSANWQWGATIAMGPLTISEGGTLRVSLYDPTRKYDPANPASPLYSTLRVGEPIRVTVDEAPAWTGWLQTWAWDHQSWIADLNAIDPVGLLSQRALPDNATIAGGALVSGLQVKALLDKVNWDVTKRYMPTGENTGIPRGNTQASGSALDAIGRVNFAELGALFPRRDGAIGWHNRAGPAAPAVSAVICAGGATPGVDLMDAWVSLGLGRIRNRVVVNGTGAFNPGGVAAPVDEQRSVITDTVFLQFDAATGGVGMWQTWADTILNALAHPPALTMLGTIVPRNAEVKQILCSEYEARWTVSKPDGNRTVKVLGQRVNVAPNSIEVDAVTEDVP